MKMKKMIMMVIFTIFSVSLFAQSDSYLRAKQVVINNGYTIVEEKEAYVIQGSYLYNYRTFQEGVSYFIYADSDDSDVQDIDIYTYYSDNTIRDKDTTADRNAAIAFTPGATIYLKIVVTNYRSYDTINKSMCRYFIAYR